jgi:excisionase family DNA binding protein
MRNKEINYLKRKPINPESSFDQVKEWLTNVEVLESLQISKRTLQQWRDSGVIGFAKIGRKIYYRLTDINQLLSDNYCKPF